MLEKPTQEWRLVSNGKKFQIIEVKHPQKGLLPVPVWEDDTRTMEKKCRQAGYNLKSRTNFISNHFRNNFAQKSNDDGPQEESNNKLGSNACSKNDSQFYLSSALPNQLALQLPIVD